MTVPAAWRGDDGRIEIRPVRVGYSAPRLLRDRIRGEDGSYVQDWAQPMMKAIFGDDEEKVNPQELKDAAVQLMPDYDSKGGQRVLLNFPLDLDEGKIKARIGKAELWEKQFVSWKKGSRLPFLRWAEEFDGKEPHRWWEKVSTFRVLAADLGTRHTASVACIECSKVDEVISRLIGSADTGDWFARTAMGRFFGCRAKMR